MILKFKVLAGNDFSEVASELGSYRTASGATVTKQDSNERIVTLDAPNVERFLGLVQRSDIAPSVELLTKIMRVHG